MAKITSFQDFKLNKQLLNAIEELGFEKPTPIQAKAIPVVQSGHDLFGIAQTGTGKTAAFLLPILMKVKYAQGNDPRALILAPTRELAKQIDDHLTQLATYTDLRHVCVFGGIGPKKQAEELAKGVDIIVGTPGRVLDHYYNGHVVFKQIKTMVLDEADRMMDMGFMPQIRKLLEVLPKKKQNLLFSATMPKIVLKLSEEFLEFPQRVEVSKQATPAKTVSQSVYFVPNFLTKINLLGHLLKDEETFKKVIVFSRTRTNADNISRFLTRKGEGDVRVIHANKGQNSRQNAMDAFKEDDIRILVSTDVSARGIDVSLVSHVINFDVPVLYEDYVHRIGRTGRAENTGEAITFCNPAEEYHLGKIEKLIRMEVPKLEFPKEVEVVKTPFSEHQDIAREIDNQKRKEDPTFKGAFHEKKERKKKFVPKGKPSRGKRSGGGKKRRR